MTRDSLQFYALYLTRFAAGFGLVTLLTLLPEYIDLLNPSGFVLGMFVTSLTLAQAVAVLPLAYGGDRYDKRRILLASLLVSIAAYVGFALVSSTGGFLLARGLQGLAITGTSLMALSLVGELAPEAERANYIGKANAWRFAAGILGTLSAGVLYEQYGFGAVFAVIVALLVPATLGVWLFLEPDETTGGEGFALTDLALNRRILTLTSFRAQYAVAVTLVRTWIPIYAGVAALRGGLAYSALAVSLTIVAEKFTNMLAQPHTGRLSDRVGRAWFIFIGGGLYGLISLAVPFSPALGAWLGTPAAFPLLGPLSPAFLPLLALSGLLGVADSLREPASMALFADEGSEGGGVASSFGIRELVWRPGSVLSPIAAGLLWASFGIEWVFYLGGAAALSGVLTFVGILYATHGSQALSSW